MGPYIRCLLRLELHPILIVHDHELLAVYRLQGFPAKFQVCTLAYLVCAAVTWHRLT